MTHETLESLLALVCKSVTISQQNAQQTLYTLSDAKDAKLAYDLLSGCNLDVRFITEEDHGKLYVQNASVSNTEAKIGAVLMSSAPVFKQIKNLLDSQSTLDYNFSVSNTPSGRQLTVLLPSEKSSSAGTAAQAPQQLSDTSYKPSRKYDKQREDDSLATGPAVARKAIPKSFKTNDSGDEDPLPKRILLYLSGRAFSSTAWMMFLAIIFGVIFSLLVMFKAFLCPDVATDSRTIPSYCPKKLAPRSSQ